jgi:hypothetical protein
MDFFIGVAVLFALVELDRIGDALKEIAREMKTNNNH